jgi:hypothetical protein
LEEIMTARSTKTPAPKATTTKAPGKAVAVRPAAPVAKKVAPKAAPAKIVAPKATATPTVDLFARVEAARALGFSRKFLQGEAGLDGTTAMYRTERLGVEEAAKIEAVLVKIETGKITPPVKVAASAGSGMKHRMGEASKILAAAYQSKSLADNRKLITEALELLS